MFLLLCIFVGLIIIFSLFLVVRLGRVLAIIAIIITIRVLAMDIHILIQLVKFLSCMSGILNRIFIKLHLAVCHGRR